MQLCIDGYIGQTGSVALDQGLAGCNLQHQHWQWQGRRAAYQSSSAELVQHMQMESDSNQDAVVLRPLRLG